MRLNNGLNSSNLSQSKRNWQSQNSYYNILHDLRTQKGRNSKTPKAFVQNEVLEKVNK